MADGEYPIFKWNVPLNDPPTDLNSTAPLAIAKENQPIGSIVGEFNATDPEGDTITYSLVDEESQAIVNSDIMVWLDAFSPTFLSKDGNLSGDSPASGEVIGLWADRSGKGHHARTAVGSPYGLVI